MFNFSANHPERFLQTHDVVVVAARPPVLPPVRAPLVSRAQAEVRWKLPTIERCCARLQMILQFARSSRFSCWFRQILSAGRRWMDFRVLFLRRSAAGRVVCARSTVQQHFVSARYWHCQSRLDLTARHSSRQRHCQSRLDLAARHSAWCLAQLRDSLALALEVRAIDLARRHSASRRAQLPRSSTSVLRFHWLQRLAAM